MPLYSPALNMRLLIMLFLVLSLGSIWVVWQFPPPQAGHPALPRDWAMLVTSMRFQACGTPENSIFVIAPYGHDDNPCTLTCPCQTIAAMLRKMQGGDTIVLLDGLYSQYNQTHVFLPTR